MRSSTPPARRRNGALRSWGRDQRGVAAIEFGLLALPFFALLVAIFEIGLVFTAQAELETAVELATRQLLTGQAQQSGLTQAKFLASVCSHLPAFFTCSGVMADVQTYSNFASANTSAPSLTYDANGNVTNSWNFNMGAAGSIVVVRVFYQFPVIPGPLNFSLAKLSNGTRLLMATSVFQVEPYQSTGS